MSPLTLSPLSLADLEEITREKQTLSPPPSPLTHQKNGVDWEDVRGERREREGERERERERGGGGEREG